jgi:hypothetical protein
MSERSTKGTITSLKDFQRRTVEHALDRLYYAPDATGRFLVADEVGMGKTLVARGVIAGAIEYLETDETVDRIDIIYICSNSAIARQNVSKLGRFESEQKHSSTRITLLASQVGDLNKKTSGRKTVNLIALTPGTSFDKGQSRGKMEERALVYCMLRHLFTGRDRGLEYLLRMDVGDYWWNYFVSEFEKEGAFDSGIHQRFVTSVQESSVWPLVNEFADLMQRRKKIPSGELRRASQTIGALRRILAQASIDALEPDLVILDEFQRFKNLLEVPEDGADADDVRHLAQQLFNYREARVLLLSATPYKLFTMSGEEAVSGDDHYKDFLATTRFLVREKREDVDRMEKAFSDYRHALTTGHEINKYKVRAQQELVRVMSRTERPTIGESHMGEDLPSTLGAPTADELVGYAAMDRMAREMETSIPVDYWKSAPYFLNFMDGYKVGSTFKAMFKEHGASLIPRSAQVIRPKQIKERRPIEPGNARLRQLEAETVGKELWKLLWLPPSLPYLEPRGPFAGVDPVNVTKRLVFSSWAAAPNSIASLLSHEAARLLFSDLDAGTNPYEKSARLNFRAGEEIGTGLITLALVTPVPELARLTDPLQIVRRAGGRLVPQGEAIHLAQEAVAPHLPPPSSVVGKLSRESWYWAAPFLMSSTREILGDLRLLDDDEDTPLEDSDSRASIVDFAADLHVDDLPAQPDDLERWVAILGLAGPGNIAYRSLKRTTSALHVEEATLVRAAALIGEGFRSLFNRPEAMSLIDMLYPDSLGPYWRRVLLYCMDGDLQAVLDEYIHHLVGNSSPAKDADIIDLAQKIRESMSLKASPVHLFNPRSPDNTFQVRTRFAVRYGSSTGKAKSDETSENRMTAVQQAFNSPFWPMVLASTSVGQEGVDFHWWCHSLVHWNLPSNPVDLEQREGRIHRFKGHAVRKNVARAHREEAFAADHPDPWEALFSAALEARTESTKAQLGDLWPWWVFPGESKIQTWSPALPFSKDLERETRLRRLRNLYRLAFGQPRQEQLIGLLGDQVSDFEPLDLRPPR